MLLNDISKNIEYKKKYNIKKANITFRVSIQIQKQLKNHQYLLLMQKKNLNKNMSKNQ